MPPQDRTLRERVGALRNLPPFLSLVWQTSPALTVANLALRMFRALLPVVTLYVGKLIIDEVVRLAGLPVATGGPARLVQRRAARHARLAAGPRARAGRALRRARPRRRAGRRAALGAIHQRHQHAPDGARRDARSRGLRGQRAAGQPGARAPAGQRPPAAARPAVRPGAGHHHHRQLRRRPHRLRAGVDRAAPDRAGPGVSRRGALQRAQLLARLRPHARTPRAGLRAANRRQRRDREGSEDLRSQRVSDRALQDAGRRLLSRQSCAGAAQSPVGRTAHDDRDDGLLRGLRAHRVADATGRLHHRRPHVSRGRVPAIAHAAREPARRVLAGGRTGAVSGRPVLVLRRAARDRLRARRAAVPHADSDRASHSRTSASSIPAPSAGPCGICPSRSTPEKCWRWSAKTAPARRRW